MKGDQLVYVSYVTDVGQRIRKLERESNNVMEIQLLTALLGICLSLGFSVGIGEDEDEAQFYSFNSQAEKSSSMLGDCAEPEALGFEESRMELPLPLQRRQARSKSKNEYVARMLEHGNRARICPSENSKDLGDEKPNTQTKTKMKMPKEEDYEDDERNKEEADSKSSDEKQLTTRIACILRTLYDHSKAMSADLEELDAGIRNPMRTKPLPQCKSSKNKRPRKLGNQMGKEDIYYDVDNPRMNYAIVSENAADDEQLKCVQSVKDNEADTQSAIGEEFNNVDPELCLQDDQEPDRIPLVDLQLPFMVPSASVLVPLLNRRSWSLAVPNFENRRRYLHALNELRLARAIQEAAAARYRHKQRKEGARSRSTLMSSRRICDASSPIGRLSRNGSTGCSMAFTMQLSNSVQVSCLFVNVPVAVHLPLFNI